MATPLTDLRHAVRVAFQNPRFSLAAIAALTLGIGANTAIFSVVNGVLLRPLPYAEPDRLMQVCRAFQNGTGCPVSVPKFTAWRAAKSFEGLTAYDFAGPGMNISAGDRPEQVKGIHVSVDFFRVFGARTVLGRTFTADEDRPNGPRVVVLSHRLFTDRFGSDPQVLTRPLTINGEPFTVLGVLERSFQSDPPADLYLPLQPDPNSANHGNFLSVAARLAPGATREKALAELKLIGDGFRRANPRWMTDQEGIAVVPMQERVVRDIRPALRIMLGAVGLVLLIACANVANLQLARGAGRQREIAIRASIGAGRRVIVRQLLVESLLIALAGALVGLLAGVAGARWLLTLSPAGLPRARELGAATFWTTLVDWRLLGFTAAIAMATAVLCGLAPALYLSRADLGLVLKEGGGRGATSGRAARTRAVLVVAEIALALVLLVGAALLIRTFMGLRRVQPGVDAANVLTFQTSLAGARFATTGQVEALTKGAVRRLSALPGVAAAATSIAIPTEGDPDLPFAIDGRPLSGDSRYHGDENWVSISPEYFRVLRVPFLRGRAFTENDRLGTSPVVIVNAAFARKYFQNADPIGQRLTIGQGLGPEFEDPSREIVGVVGDVKDNGLDQPAPGIMYVPAAQISDSFTKLGNGVVPVSWLVRTTADPQSFTPAIEKAILAADALIPISGVRPMEQVIGQSIGRQTFNMLLLSVFGVVALLLSAIGIYGLISYTVEQRTHDIGIRLALGADRGQILRLVLGDGMKMAFVGFVLGIAAALGAGRLLSAMLFGVKATDPLTFVVVVSMLGVVTMAACYLPARRAMAVDPIIALRRD